MKRLQFYCFLLLATSLFSCKKAVQEYVSNLLEAQVIFKQNIGFPFPMEPTTTDSVSAPPYTIPMNVDSVLRTETNNNFGKKDLKSAKMTSIKLYMPITTPITASNLDTIRLTAQVSSSPDLLTIEVTDNFNIITEQDYYILDLPVDSDRELINYLSSSSISYSFYGKFKNDLTFTAIGFYNMQFTYKLLVKKIQ